jgi:hypothetical protein
MSAATLDPTPAPAPVPDGPQRARHGGVSALPPRARAVVIALGLVALQALVVLLFAWPNARLAPRDLPLVVTGPPAAVASVEDALAGGSIDLSVVADEEAARAAVLDREAYGALVLDPAGTTVLTAAGASAAVAQQLQQLAAAAVERPGETPASTGVAVVDVAPGAPDDPRGAALAASLLPLVLTGMVCGLLLTLLVPGTAARAIGIVVFALAGGLVSTAVVQGFLGALTGSYWSNAGVVALTLLAIAATVAGLGTVLGRAGLALGAATMFLLGNPLSGIASAPELLPQPWGALGQLLPPGAGGTLLRNVAFFDGAAVATPLLVLGAWATVGLALLAAGSLRPGGRAHAPAPA